ncbi:MAG: ABC transporter ATP-binding protein [Chitinophagales bacterium]
MSNDFAIKVENVSKVFSVSNTEDAEMGNGQELWALKNLSFEIKKGESVGIIGPNGSGKSTLLKILANVTYPSTGQVRINGRLASILDIGAGFHPELSGRENIYLNGQILGFSKREIRQKFDQIVEFSGIERFIAEPVKKYSNGMYLRLAFSIMAHLDFDIYLFDEVLSVGDAEFRNKIKKKTESIIDSEKTILYVTHNLNDIVEDYTKGIILRKGEIEFMGNNNAAVKKYMNDLYAPEQSEKEIKFDDVPEDYKVKITGVEISPKEKIYTSSAINIELDIEKADNIKEDVVFGIVLYDSLGNPVFTAMSNFAENQVKFELEKGQHKISCEIPANFLSSGTFVIDLYFACPESKSKLVRKKRAMVFQVEEEPEISNLSYSIGPLRPKFKWHLKN